MTVTRKIKLVHLTVFILSLTLSSIHSYGAPPLYDTIKKSTSAEAFQYLNSIKGLRESKWWPNVDPAVLLNNLKTFTVEPFAFYEGRTTNFCAYSALTYIPLTYDPLGFATFMIDLYKNGKAQTGKDMFHPSKAVRKEAGLLRYKGPLDLNAAGQMWFLTLADHYKGYLNFFNRHFNKGDENTFWAATNYAKFNKMLRRLFRGSVKTRGADLIKPRLGDPSSYLQKQMQQGLVFLYLNNKKLYKKTHTRALISTPTHYVLLTNIRNHENGTIEFEYWDYGKRTVQQLSPEFLKNIIYGITVWNPNKLK